MRKDILKWFEFDVQKSTSNLEKHGIDFYKSVEIWNDKNSLIFKSRSFGESRWIVIGKLSNKLWVGVFTYRKSKIRIISVRRARKKEVNLYEQKNNN